MKTRKLYATASDGTTVTRRTHRDYAFAVVAGVGGDNVGTVGFSGSYGGATKMKAAAINRGHLGVEIVAVREEA